jgi:hypothetical protein
MALTPKRIYGDYQTAGLLVTTTGKSQVNNDGTDAYAQAVFMVDASGAIVGNNTSQNITTNATTTVKTGAGTFAGLSINTAGATSTATVYDNTAGSGTKLGTFSTTAQGYIPVNIPFATGLTVVTAGGTPADITVVYR